MSQQIRQYLRQWTACYKCDVLSSITEDDEYMDRHYSEEASALEILRELNFIFNDLVIKPSSKYSMSKIYILKNSGLPVIVNWLIKMF